MALKIDTKYERNLTCAFKNVMSTGKFSEAEK